jgi:CubicO group peptidase (beta-lactamase class C family)
MPAAWGSVTVRQLLNHTSGLPDYTTSDGFAERLKTDPRALLAKSADEEGREGGEPPLFPLQHSPVSMDP